MRSVVHCAAPTRLLRQSATWLDVLFLHLRRGPEPSLLIALIGFEDFLDRHLIRLVLVRHEVLLNADSVQHRDCLLIDIHILDSGHQVVHFRGRFITGRCCRVWLHLLRQT